jgi:hypothetical protein
MLGATLRLMTAQPQSAQDQNDQPVITDLDELLR